MTVYTIALVALVLLLIGSFIHAGRAAERRDFRKMFAHLGWVCWSVGIIWVGALLMELADLNILSSYTNYSDGAFMVPFVAGAFLFAASGFISFWTMFSNWRERERNKAALAPVESEVRASLATSHPH